MNTKLMQFFLFSVTVTAMVSVMILLGSCTKKSGSDKEAAYKSEGSEIIIGHYGSLTGSEATFGMSTDAGVRLALDQVNEKGGVKGRKIKLITMDDQGKSEEAASVVTRMIEQEKVVALIGEVASGRSLAAAPIAQNKKIPMVSPSSTSPKVTEVGDYIFRVCFIDPFQGTVMAKFSREQLKIQKVAIFRDVKSDYSVGLADFYAQKFIELGGEIVVDVGYQSGDVDFKAQLTQIKSKNPEAIFVPGYYTEVGLIARQTRELGITATLLGGDGWDSPKLSEIAQKSVDGGYFSNHYSNESKEPVVVDFVSKYKEKYKNSPDGLAAAGYDAANILVKAMENAKEIKPESIRNELAKIQNFEGVTGKITIDEKRNANKSAVVVKVQGALNQFVTTISP